MPLDVDRLADVVLALVKSQNAPLVELLARVESRLDSLEQRAAVPGRDGRDGERGERGEIGPQGTQGEKGEAGEKGIQGEAGAAGATGPQGEKGEKGDPGEAGPQGPQGEKGLNGRDGIDGKDGESIIGPRGERGEKGDPGVMGPRGERGEKGLDGKDGRDGFGPDDFNVTQSGKEFTFTWKKGEDAKSWTFTVPSMEYRGVWSEGESYRVGDTVTWAGSCWICSEDTDAKPNLNTDESRKGWRLAVRKGQDGKAGRDGKDGKNGKDGKDRL